MITLAEILDAARKLKPDEQRQLIRTLRAELSRNTPDELQSPLGLPADFTERLTKLFYEAKLKALSDIK